MTGSGKGSLRNNMNKRKKNLLLVLIYTIMILFCFGIVMVVDHLDTSDRDRKETSGRTSEECPDRPGQEESTEIKDHINPLYSADHGRIYRRNGRA